MATLVTRSGKGSPLTHAEVDANFTNLNTDKLELSGGTMTGNLSFGDDDKAIFGAGSDLQIYSDGANSIIQESDGTGNLLIRASNINLQNSGATATLAQFIDGGKSSLRYNGSEKLATTSTGISVTGDATFADNGKAIFGAGSDLQIYHDGSNSYILDNGIGDLRIQGYQFIKINNVDGSKTSASFNVAGPVLLNHNNSEKLATTSTGVDITGTLTSDGLTVDGAIQVNATVPSLVLEETDTTDINGQVAVVSGITHIRTINDAGNSVTNRLSVNNSTGDISFYEDTGTTAKFFWDASAESLGIGTTTPNGELQVLDNSSNCVVNFTSAAGSITALGLGDVDDLDNGAIWYSNADNSMRFYANAGERMRIDSSGNVGIGTSSPAERLHVSTPSSSGTEVAARFSSNSDASGCKIERNGSAWRLASQGALQLGADYDANGTSPDSVIIFEIDAAETMRIDSSGNLLVGTTSSAISGNQTGIGTSSTFKVAGLVGDVGISNTGNQITFSRNSANYISAFGGASASIRYGAQGSHVFSVAADGATEAMRIDSSGNLLVGTTTIPDGTNKGMAWANTGDESLKIGTSSTVGDYQIRFYNGNGNVGNIITSGSATSYNTSSDYRLKENVVELTGATDRLKQLEPKRFNFIADADTTVDGFLAHEVQSVVPEAITGTHNEVDADGNPVYQGIDQSKLVPLLVATIKELEARITALENA